MKRRALFLLLLPGVAHSGGSDPGLLPVFMWLVGIAFGFWVIVSVFFSFALVRSKPLALVLAAVMISSPLAYFSWTSYEFNKRMEQSLARNRALVAVANEYLAQRCASDRVQRAPMQVDPAGGLLVAVDTRQMLDLPDAPPPPRGPPQPGAIQRSEGESDAAVVHEVQYKQPVYWVRQLHAGSVLLKSPFPFVEDTDRYAGGQLQAAARMPWWRGPGRKAIAASSREELERRLDNSYGREQDMLTLPVKASLARYVVSVEDISTVEDRKHWVARARLRLVHRASGDTAAEYVGFAVNLVAGEKPSESYPWERVTVCPGKERDYQEERVPWDVAGFFFREVVSYKGGIAK